MEKLNPVRRIFKNTSVLIGSHIVSKGISLILLAYLARYLGKGQMGIYAFALSFTIILVVLGDLGIRDFVVREVSRKREEAGHFYANGLGIKAVLSLFSLIVIILITSKIGGGREKNLVILYIGLAAIIGSFSDFTKGFFRAFEKMEYELLGTLLERFSILGLVLWGIHQRFPLVKITELLLLGSLFGIMCNTIIFLLKISRPYPSFKREHLLGILRGAAPFALSIVFGTIYWQIDTVMVSLMRGDVETGLYGVAYRPLLSLFFLPSFFMISLFPVMSRSYPVSKEKVADLYRKSFKYLFLIGFPLSVTIFVLSPQIILILYGKEYMGSVTVMMVLSWFIFLKFLNYSTGTVLWAINRQKQRAESQGITVAVNVILNYILIKRYGFLGAGISTLITEVFLFALYFGSVSKYLCLYRFPRVFYKPFLISLFLGLTIFILKREGLFLLIPGVIPLYLLSLSFLKVIDQEDRRLLGRLIRPSN